MTINGDNNAPPNEGADIDSAASCPTCNWVGSAKVLTDYGCPDCRMRSYGTDRLKYERIGS